MCNTPEDNIEIHERDSIDIKNMNMNEQDKISITTQEEDLMIKEPVVEMIKEFLLTILQEAKEDPMMKAADMKKEDDIQKLGDMMKKRISLIEKNKERVIKKTKEEKGIDIKMIQEMKEDRQIIYKELKIDIENKDIEEQSTNDKEAL